MNDDSTISTPLNERDLVRHLREQSLQLISSSLDEINNQHPLDLPQIMNSIRPTLGDSVTIPLYRTIRLLAFREVLGAKISSSILNISGRSIAEKMDIGSIEDLVKILEDFAISRITVEKHTDDQIIISAVECATCSGVPNIGQALCCFEGGFIAGGLQKVTGERYKPVETNCWGLGDEICRWRLNRLNGNGSSNDASVDPLDVLMTLASKAASSVDTSIAIRQKNHQLREANQKFRESERLKKDLTDMIIHDMRVPLSSVMGSLEMISDLTEQKLSPQENKLLNIAVSSSQTLVNMVNDLQDISRLEERKLNMGVSPVSVSAVIEQAVNNTEMLVRKKKLTLHTEIAANLPDIRGDKDRLIRVIVNLLANAVRHSSSDGLVTIKADIKSDGNMLVIRVIDNGEGIPEEYQHRIFDKFVQIDASRSRRRNSSGLGLNFCKMITEAHGGTISVESEPGLGSTFTIELPVPTD
ncbi:MAG: ATP-binding protein [Armatimonadota bacterium]